MFAEDLGVLLNLLLVAILGCFDQDQQRNIGLQEGVRDVVHHCFTQLREIKNVRCPFLPYMKVHTIEMV